MLMFATAVCLFIQEQCRGMSQTEALSRRRREHKRVHVCQSGLYARLSIKYTRVIYLENWSTLTRRERSNCRVDTLNRKAGCICRRSCPGQSRGCQVTGNQFSINLCALLAHITSCSASRSARGPCPN